MRYFLFFIILLGAGFLKAQSSIVGFVKLQSSGNVPLPDVEVYALGAQATYTDDKGYFELIFNSKSAGDLINSIEFSLSNFIIINEEKCQDVIIYARPLP